MKSTTNLRLSFISKKKLNINKLKALILFSFSSLTAFLQVSLVSVFGGSSLSLSCLLMPKNQASLLLLKDLSKNPYDGLKSVIYRCPPIDFLSRAHEQL
ncbi:unnamed protein product [Brassica oleracea var. botrytis]|uniref:Uncharacterized protein n=3 Tax=Brassica TaxID=3705 RepID=A0ABQ7Y3Y7_BRANA|nr:hypothetical protein HID58_080095 [Brassica napus]CDY12402.1 BnaC08g08030D [Brassica napus]VDD54813.1 unnamed protein product [Brassica oleracea]